MERLGIELHKNAWEYTVMGVLTMDKSSRRMSVEIYTISPNGHMSDIFTITRKDFYTKKNPLEFFYDMEGDFGRDDIATIGANMVELFKNEANASVVQGKATLEEIHRAVSDFIREYHEDLEDNPQADVFIKDGFGFLLPSYMDLFVKSYGKELGYTKRVDILKRLKIMGAIHHGNNRPYDILISRKGIKQRFYKIELADEMSGEQTDEVVM